MIFQRTAGLVALGLIAGLSTAFAAKDVAKPADAPAVPADPQQTSATFGDWVVRCDRPGAPPAGQPAASRICEAAQSLVVKGQQAPLAQIAFGHGVEPGGPLLVTLLLPVSIAFDKPPQVGSGATAADGPAVTLAFRRCIPAGCLADTKPDAAFLKELKSAQKPGRIVFTDAAERSLTLPLSFRGLAQALDDLAKESAKDAGTR